MMEQYEKDKEIERLNKDVSRLEELLSVSETQYASVEQIVERLQEQIADAIVILMRFERVTPLVFGGKYLQADLERFYKKWGVK